MVKTLSVIFIPGLGDVPDPRFQLALVRSWKKYGVEPETFLMRWADNELWQVKFDRLLKRIDELNKEGYAVGLVGASAGASVAINAFAERPDIIVGVVLVAGKVNRPGSIGSDLKKNNTALPVSVSLTGSSLDKLSPAKKLRILSRHAFMDNYVHRSDSLIPGAINQTVPSIGHVLTIASQLVFGAPSFLKFLKQLNNKVS